MKDILNKADKLRTPGEVLLEDFLQPMGLSQKQLAQHLGWTVSRLNEIIKAKRSLSADSALSLAQAFETCPEFWMDLQRDIDLRNAAQSHQTVSKIKAVSVEH